MALIEIVLPDGSPAFMAALFEETPATDVDIALDQARRAYETAGWEDTEHLVARHMVVIARQQDWP